MRLSRIVISIILLTGCGLRAANAELLFTAQWGDNAARVQELSPGYPAQQGTLDSDFFLLYDIILEGCPAGVVYRFDNDRLYAVAISLYVYVETVTGLALVQKLTERLQSMSTAGFQLEKNKVKFDRQTQITHTGQYFSGADTKAFIFAKIWPEEEGRLVIMLEFTDAAHPAAKRLPGIFQDLFRR